MRDASHRMKILIVHSQLGVLRGGGENFTRNLFTAFAARGHQVSAAFVADRRGKYAIALPPSIEPIPMPGWWSRSFGQPTLMFIGARIPSGFRLKAGWERLQDAVGWRVVRWHNQRFRKHVLKRFAGHWSEFDAVYVHGNASLAGDIAKHCPTVIRLPGPADEGDVGALHTVHAVCANGDALKRTRQILGDKALELPIGLDEQVFAPGPSSVRSALGWTAKDVVIGYVGRLTRFKGVDVLGAAFRDLLGAVPEARLLIVGRGEEETNLRYTLRDPFADRNVHIEPDVDHDSLPEWYRAMDVMVMPSRYENFSNAVVEAMACGVPVVASDVGGNIMLESTGGAWLFDTESPKALSARLAEILGDRAALKARGRQARESMQRISTWDATANRLEEIITCATQTK
jgi:glycosyltransferase involved in cell wall biosynthesis